MDSMHLGVSKRHEILSSKGIYPFYQSSVFIKVQDGRTLSLPFDPILKICCYKKEIEAREGVPFTVQRLLFAGKQLREDFCLSDYGIFPDATLHLVGNLSGGMKAGDPVESTEKTLVQNKVADAVFDNAQQLARVLQSTSAPSWLEKIPDAMVFQFTQIRSLDPAHLEELAAVTGVVSASSCRQITGILIHSLKDNIERSNSFFQALAKMIVNLKHANDLDIIQAVNHTKIEDPQSFLLSLGRNSRLHISDAWTMILLLVDKLSGSLELKKKECILLMIVDLLEAIMSIGALEELTKEEVHQLLEKMQSFSLKENSADCSCFARYSCELIKTISSCNKQTFLNLPNYINAISQLNQLKQTSWAISTWHQMAITLIEAAYACSSISALYLFRKISEFRPDFLVMTAFWTSKEKVSLAEDRMATITAVDLLKKIVEDPDRDPILREAAMQHLEKMKTTYSSSASFSSLPTFLLEKALRLHAPIDWKLKRVLRNDLVIQQELPYYVPLQAKSENSTASLEELIPPFLESKNTRMFSLFLSSNEQRVLLITGATGSGKTFFVKKYAWENLQEYASDNFLVIFVSLPDLKNPFKDLIKEVFLRYGVDLVEEDSLKEKKVLWIFDGYDEIQFAKSGSETQFKNLYATNSLNNWPNWKFIFTCRTGHSFEHFKPTDGLVTCADILPLSKEKVLGYITNYILNKKDYPLDYKVVSERIEYFGLTDVVSNARILKNVLDILPLMSDQFSAMSLKNFINTNQIPSHWMYHSGVDSIPESFSFSFNTPNLIELNEIFKLEFPIKSSLQEFKWCVCESILQGIQSRAPNQWKSIRDAEPFIAGLRDRQNQNLFFSVLRATNLTEGVIDSLFPSSLWGTFSSGELFESPQALLEIGKSNLLPLIAKYLVFQQQSPNRKSWVHTAIASGHSEIVQAFVEHKISVEPVYLYREVLFTPAMWAVVRGERSSFTPFVPYAFLQKNSVLGNFLHLAIQFRQMGMLRRLLISADTHKYTEKLLQELGGREAITPLMLAAYLGNIEAVILLKEHGADLKQTDSRNRTALHWAAAGLRPAIFEQMFDWNLPKDTKDANGEKAIDILQKRNIKLKSSSTNVLENFFFCGDFLGDAYVGLGITKSVKKKFQSEQIKRVGGVSFAGSLLAFLVAFGLDETLLSSLTFAKQATTGSLTDILQKNYQLQNFWEIMGMHQKESSHSPEMFEYLWSSTGSDEREADWQTIEEAIAKQTKISNCTFGELKQLIQKGRLFKHLHLFAIKIGKMLEPVEFSSEDPKWKEYIISDAVCTAISIAGWSKPHILHAKEKGIRVAKKQAGVFIGGMLPSFEYAEVFDSKLYVDHAWSMDELSDPIYNNRTLTFIFSPMQKAENSGKYLLFSRIKNLLDIPYTFSHENRYNASRMIRIEVADPMLFPSHLKEQSAKCLSAGSSFGEAVLSPFFHQDLGALQEQIALLNDSEYCVKAKTSPIFALSKAAKKGIELPPQALDICIPVIYNPNKSDHAQYVYSSAVVIGKIAEGNTYASLRALEVLIDLLKNPSTDSDIKIPALQSLYNIATSGRDLPEGILDAIIVVLLNPDPFIDDESDERSQSVAGIINEINNTLAHYCVGILEVFVEKKKNLSPRILEVLIQMLSAIFGRHAASALGKIALAEQELSLKAFQALIDELDSSAVGPWNAAVYGLQIIAEKEHELSSRALQALINVLKRSKKGDPDLKDDVVHVLGDLAKKGKDLPEEALLLLVDLVFSREVEDPSRRSAVDAIVKIARAGQKLSSQAWQSLIEILKNFGTDYQTKKFLMDALCSVPEKEEHFFGKVWQQVIDILNYPAWDDDAKGSAVEAIQNVVNSDKNLPSKVFEALVQIIHDFGVGVDVKLSTVRAIGVIARSKGVRSTEAQQCLRVLSSNAEINEIIQELAAKEVNSGRSTKSEVIQLNSSLLPLRTAKSHQKKPLQKRGSAREGVVNLSTILEEMIHAKGAWMMGKFTYRGHGEICLIQLKNRDRVFVDLVSLTGIVMRDNQEYPFSLTCCEELKKIGAEKLSSQMYSEDCTIRVDIDESQNISQITLSQTISQDSETRIFWMKRTSLQGKYYLSLVPSQLIASQCFIEKSDQTLERISLDLSHLALLNCEQISFLFAHPSKLATSLNPKPFAVKVYQKDEPDISVKNAKELAQILPFVSNKNSWLHQLAYAMISSSNRPDIQEEIAELVKAMPLKQIEEVLRHILTVLERQQIPILSLTKILNAWKLARIDAWGSPLIGQQLIDFKKTRKSGSLETSLAVNLLEILMKKLANIKEESEIASYLNAIVIILEGLIVGPSFDVEQQIYSSLSHEIGKLQAHRQLRISYLANFALRLLIDISNKQGHFLEAMECSMPDLVLGQNIGTQLFFSDRIAEFKNIFLNLLLPPEEWVVDLFTLRLIGANHPALFLHLNTLQKAGISCNHLCLIFGLVDHLKAIFEQPKIENMIAKRTTLLLKEIMKANSLSTKSHFLRIQGKGEDRQQLCQYVQEVLDSCSGHPQKAVRKAVSGKTAVILKRSIKRNPVESTELFDTAYRKFLPTELHLLKILKGDVNFHRQLNSYVPLHCVQNGFSSPLSAEEAILNLLADQEKQILFITGPAASGKTFLLKKFAWDRLSIYNPQDSSDYLVVYVPLDHFLKKVFKGDVLEAALEKYAMDDSSLQEKKILWLFDGYDGLGLDVLKKELSLTRFYHRHLKKHPLNPCSKFVFTCREGFYEEGILASSGATMMKVQLRFFPDKYIKNFGSREMSKCVSIVRQLTKLGYDAAHLFSNPFLFQAVTCNLGTIMDQSQATTETSFDLLTLDQLSTYRRQLEQGIDDAIVCAMVVRVQQICRMSPSNPPDLESAVILHYCSTLARMIVESTNSLTGFVLKEMDMEELRRQVEIVEEEELFLRTSLLIFVEGEWRFFSARLLLYFNKLHDNKEKRKLLLEKIENDTYLFQEKSFYL